MPVMRGLGHAGHRGSASCVIARCAGAASAIAATSRVTLCSVCVRSAPQSSRATTPSRGQPAPDCTSRPRLRAMPTLRHEVGSFDCAPVARLDEFRCERPTSPHASTLARADIDSSESCRTTWRRTSVAYSCVSAERCRSCGPACTARSMEPRSTVDALAAHARVCTQCATGRSDPDANLRGVDPRGRLRYSFVSRSTS